LDPLQLRLIVESVFLAAWSVQLGLAPECLFEQFHCVRLRRNLFEIRLAQVVVIACCRLLALLGTGLGLSHFLVTQRLRHWRAEVVRPLLSRFGVWVHALVLARVLFFKHHPFIFNLII